MQRTLKIFTCTLTVLYAFAFSEISMEQVYWWWDDGLIEYSAVNDFLQMFESDDEEGVCLYAEALGLEKCERKESLKNTSFGGYVRFVESRDSSDAVLLRKAETSLRYNSYSFWGKAYGENFSNVAWQVAYQEGPYKAFLGEIRYSNMQIGFPLKKTTGTWLSLELYKFKFGGGLFTDVMLSEMIGVTFKEVSFFTYAFEKNEEASYAFEAKNESFTFGAFYMESMKSPFYRGSVFFHAKNATQFQWKGLFYAHEDSLIPFPLELPFSVIKARYWAQQTEKFSFKKSYVLTFVERFNVPLDTGKTAASASVTFQKKNGMVRSLFGFACRDFSEGCARPQIRIEPGLFVLQTLFYTKFRLQGETFDDLNHLPRMVFGIKHTKKSFSTVRTEVAFSESGMSSKNPCKFSEEAGINLKNVAVSMRLVFVLRPKEYLKAERMGITAKVKW